jgi:hypothetical protein
MALPSVLEDWVFSDPDPWAFLRQHADELAVIARLEGAQALRLWADQQVVGYPYVPLQGGSTVALLAGRGRSRVLEPQKLRLEGLRVPASPSGSERAQVCWTVVITRLAAT